MQACRGAFYLGGVWIWTGGTEGNCRECEGICGAYTESVVVFILTKLRKNSVSYVKNHRGFTTRFLKMIAASKITY